MPGQFVTSVSGLRVKLFSQGPEHTSREGGVQALDLVGPAVPQPSSLPPLNSFLDPECWDAAAKPAAVPGTW